MHNDLRPQINELVAAMTVDEKLDLLTGTDSMWTKGVPRLGVRRVRMADATMGLREDNVPATAFPAFLCLAATWNREVAAAYGRAVGEEFRAAGIDVLLGPGVNLYRTHHGGRNFEYLGEDPCLAAELVVPYIQAVQEQGVAATVKHFAANNSDWHRSVSNSVIDERTLRERYFPVFEAAIGRAGVRCVMTSYNLLNGEYTAENRWLLTDVLLGDWQFTGLVMSDWAGTWDTEKAFQSGLHLEMPGGKVWAAERLRTLLAAGKLAADELDRKVSRLVEWTLELDAHQAAVASTPHGRCPAHAEVALQTAREGSVLLRNRDGLLPLAPTMKTLAVVGPAACPTPTSGGGAARVAAVDPVSILGAINRLAPAVRLTRGERDDDLKTADAVIVCVGYDAEREREGCDRPFELPWPQVQLIRRCTAANPNTIVVVVAGGGVEMASWIDGTAAVLHAWYPGENGCQAVAEILFGEVNPSGRLPFTLERAWPDAAAFGHYIPEGEAHYADPDYVSQYRPAFDVAYAEGVFGGYAHFDRSGTAPLFPFGFGLSYTTFAYAGLAVRATAEGGAEVRFRVRNTGGCAGAEVAQVYVGDLVATVPRPVKELKGFVKLFLQPGEEREAVVTLERRAFAFYDVATHAWCVEPGEFRISVGASARDLRLNASLTL